MAKSTTVYWNPMNPDQRDRWQPVQGLEGMAEELTLSMDEATGEYTRLTRFLPGADTTPFGGKHHDYPSRPPGEVHGPFKTDSGCVVLEMSFPNKVHE
jgi:hypothetical protein